MPKIKSAARPLVACLLLLPFFLAPGASAQSDEKPAAPPPSTAANLIELNRAIKAYLDADVEQARELFESILARDAENTAALYYLGLIYLDEGLQLASASDADGARTKFDQARENLKHVMLSADPSVTPVEAALLLGIAQLAADVPDAEGAAHELALAAHDTLKRYVETVDVGKNDRYGFFYLGVSCYRLGDYYSIKNDNAKAGEQLEAAVRALETAQQLADVDKQRYELDETAPHGMSAGAYDQFKQVVSYYRGLVGLQRRQNREARLLLEYVRDNERGALGQNASSILDKMDEIEATSPMPMSFDSPLGRLDVQGAISLGADYDTNVILLGKDTILPLGIGRKYDYTFDAAANFYVSRYIDNTQAPVGESLSFGIGGGTTDIWCLDINEFNLNLYSGRAFVQWQPVRNWYLGVEYEYSYSLLGSSPFISSNRLTPVLSHIWRDKQNDELGRTDVWYNFDYRDYRGETGDFRLDRDGKYHALGVRHTFNLKKAADLWTDYYAAHENEARLFGHRWLNFSLGYVYRNEITHGTEFDLIGHSILAGVECPLPWRLTLSFDSVLTWEDYKAPSLFDYRRNERGDFAQLYDFGLTRTIVAKGENSHIPTLEIALRAGVTLNFKNSNIWDRLGQDVYEYDRAQYGLRLNIDF